MINLSKPTIESVKEVGRWLVSAVVAWIITQTLAQMDLVPEFYKLNVWVFTYTIPIRATFAFALTAAGRAIDKYVFVKSKEDPKRPDEVEPTGVIPF